ncbi:hypothetical protein HU200_042945 [Digitaria exilis]|uniref:Uncharacterized protein n=1 Tax=Digitaria exilis TaxID=1010633 RepID=A0A835B9Y6_9POAL|nr:hypothetical protein HU200_042945 [Digitaria exilis]
MKIVLDRYGFDVQPEMVNQNIIETAGLVFECDYNVYKHADNMRYAGEHLTKISGIHVEDWDLFKLATALMIVAYPNGEQVVAGNPEKLPTLDSVCMSVGWRESMGPTLLKDALKYKDKLRDVACFRVYREMLRAPKIRHKALKQLVLLTRLAREDYEAQKATNHE